MKKRVISFMMSAVLTLSGLGCGRKLGMEGIVFTDYETGKKKLEQILMAKSKED